MELEAKQAICAQDEIKKKQAVLADQAGIHPRFFLNSEHVYLSQLGTSQHS